MWFLHRSKISAEYLEWCAQHYLVIPEWMYIGDSSPDDDVVWLTRNGYRLVWPEV